jgi:hypothetical protein
MALFREIRSKKEKQVRLFLIFLIKTITISSAAFFIIQDAMQPHPVSSRGPWFEGWYYRIYDPEQRFTWVMIATSAYRDGVEIPGYLSSLVQYGDESAPRVYESYPPNHRVQTPNSLWEDENWEAEKFIWSVPGLARVSDRQVDLNLPEFAFKARVKERLPWAPFEIGPGMPMRFIKGLPLYWYVDNTGGRVQYWVRDQRQGQLRQFSGEGFIHQEKNWGEVFPSAWMWLQAISPAGEASIALAGGRLPVFGVELHSYMVGFKNGDRSYEFSLAIDPRTQFVQKVDACSGRFELEAYSGDYRMRLRAQAPTDSFAFVSIPTENGYQPEGGMESFRGAVRIEIFRNDLFSQAKIEDFSFADAALEFGADYMICE